MALDHLQNTEVFDLHDFGGPVGQAASQALLKTEQIELMRLVLPQGQSVPQHQVAGLLTLQCLVGELEIDFGADAAPASRTLQAGQIMYLAGGQPHALKALADSALLLTVLLAPQA